MIVRSKAPVRLGFAGGGTDISPYSDNYGGVVLNSTINLYAHATITPKNDGTVVLLNQDSGESLELNASKELTIDGHLDIQKAIFNYYLINHAQKSISIELITSIDVPSGSGLGTSSALSVAIIGAFNKYLKIEMDRYEIADIACKIERDYLKQAGGKQDQYAATFGGFNFMEFYAKRVVVNPLRIIPNVICELEKNLLLYYTGTQRLSSQFIMEQRMDLENKNEKSLYALHEIKKQASQMKEALLMGRVEDIGELLNIGWEQKKKLSQNISNSIIEKIYNTAISAGATGGKVSGAGGGGFMFFYCPTNTRNDVENKLNRLGGESFTFNFTTTGLTAWTIAQ